ncbi:MAG: hypothetical protein AAGD32_17380 [Planctomycetota bacterium]
MKYMLTGMMVLAMTASASAQLTDEEMRQRMEELNKRAESGETDTTDRDPADRTTPQASNRPTPPALRSDAPPVVKELYDRLVRRLPVVVAEAKKELREAERALDQVESGRIVPARKQAERLSSGYWVFPDESSKAAQVEVAQREVEAAQARVADAEQGRVMPRATAKDLEDLDGAQVRNQWKVFQVLDDQNALLVYGYYTQHVEQYVQGQPIVRNTHNWSDPVWVSGVSTAGWVDDRVVEGLPPLIQSGTKSYQTAMGQRTAPMLESADAAITRYLDVESEGQ